MVPLALRPARDASGPSRLWSNPGYGWNRLALPPPVGRARASLLDEPGRGVAWQRPPLVLPRRGFRYGTEKSTRSRRPVRRGAHVNPNTQTPEFSLRDPDGYYVAISALPAPQRKKPARRRPNKRLRPAKAGGQIRKSREKPPRLRG